MRGAIDRVARKRPLGPLGFLFRAHLHRCPSCQRALAALEDLIRRLRTEQANAPGLPSGFWEDVERESARNRDGPTS